MADTLGSILVNQALPEEYRGDPRLFSGREYDDLMADIARKHPGKYRELSNRLMQLGRETAYYEGTTLRLSDLKSPVEDRQELFDFVAAKEKEIEKSDATENEKRQALDAVYGEVHQLIIDRTLENAVKTKNPLGLQVMTKARGNPIQLAAMVTSPGSFKDARGRVIPTFIRRSYTQGLKPHEYYAATFGTRAGVVATKFCLDEMTEVLMADYSVRHIGDIVEGDMVFSVNEDGTLTPTVVTAVCDRGMVECNDYAFRLGKSRTEELILTCSPDHKVSSIIRRRPSGRGYTVKTKSLRKFRPRTMARLAAGCDAGLAVPEAYLMGALTGDGGLTRGTVNIYMPTGQKLYDVLMQECSMLDLRMYPVCEEHGVTRYCISSETAGVPYAGGSVQGRLGSMVRAYGLEGKHSYEKDIPIGIWNWDRRSIGGYLWGLIETDGSVTHTINAYGKEYPAISMYTTSEKLARSLKRLLAVRLGIYVSPVHTRKVAGDTSIFTDDDGTVRICTRNHDLHGFVISRLAAVRAVAGLDAPAGLKRLKLTNVLAVGGYKEDPVTACRLKTVIGVGIRRAMDLEVAHPSHLFVLANGLIVSNSTREAGDLGKQMNVACADLVITSDDCGTVGGIPVATDDPDNIGAVLAKDAGGYKMGAPLTGKMLGVLGRKFDQILVRSPITCNAEGGICKLCAGQREDGEFPDLRDHIGIQASSALTERIAQSSLNTKHTGGQKGKQQEYGGFPIIEQLAEVPEAFKHRAAVAELDGTVSDIQPAPQGGTFVTIGEQQHYVDPEQTMEVKVGDTVEAGDQLSTGIVNPAEVVRHKGVGEGRRYFAERLTKAFRDSKLGINRRNAEVVARAAVNHVEVSEPNGLGDYMPGEVAQYSSFAFGYIPRPGTKIMPAGQAAGKYLEQPALHYTIGSRVTPKMAGRLKEFGVPSVTVHEQEPGFSPVMIRMRTNPHHGKDWMAKLQGSYLMDVLTDSAQKGEGSNIHGTNPVPGLAYGAEFGDNKPGKVTY